MLYPLRQSQGQDAVLPLGGAPVGLELIAQGEAVADRCIIHETLRHLEGLGIHIHDEDELAAAA